MEVRNLFERGELVLSLANYARPEEAELAANTIFGTPGGTRYSHPDTREKINQQVQPFFLSLRKGTKLLGMLGFSQRTVYQPAGSIEAFNIRYLSILPTLQRKDGNAVPTRSREDGLLRRLVRSIIDRPENMSIVKGAGPEQALFYAYVEAGNSRSKEMTETMDFFKVGEFGTVTFSRFKLKADPRVKVATEAQMPSAVEQFKDYYKEHALFSEANALNAGKYFVAMDGDKVVGGMSALNCHWVVEEMPGFSGKMAIKFLPKVPVLSKLFNPKAFRFVSAEGLWYAEGYEEMAYAMIETAMHHYQVHAAIMFQDRKSPLDAVLRNGKLGILEKFNKDNPASVIIKAKNVPEELVADMKNRPLYISGFDSV